MLNKLMGVIVLVALAVPVAWADDFWDEKDFLEWDIREVLKLRSDSPWAKRATVKVERGAAFNVNAALNDDVSARNPAAAGGGGTGFSRRSSSESIPIVVSWRSGLSFKKAIVKAAVGNSNEVTAEQQEYLAKDEEYYVLVIGSLPPDIARGFANVDDLEGKISIDRKGKEKLFVGEVQIEAGRGEVHLLFPKTDPITLDDKDAELNINIDDFSFKKKFKLEDMVVAGRLEL